MNLPKYSISGVDNKNIEFYNCELSNNSDGRLISANSNFLAMLSKKQGKIIIVNSAESTKYEIRFISFFSKQ